MMRPDKASLCVAILVCALPVAAAQGQHFDQLTRPVATIQERAMIDMFLDELLIPAPAQVDRIDVVDITGNGYGPDDMLLLYPSLETFLVGGAVPRAVQDVMKTWELEADYRLDATLQESARVAADAHRRQDARAALTGAVLQAITRYYAGDDIDMRLSRGEGGVRLEMWNYDPRAMRYSVRVRDAAPAPALTSPLEEARFRFQRPRFVLSFRDASDCVLARLEGGKIKTRPCQP